MTSKPVCVDCYPDKDERTAARLMGGAVAENGKMRAARPAPHPGPRCSTHWRDEVKRRKAAAAERRNVQMYGLAPGDYDRLYAHQGGACAICRRATGATRRLSVDHDHKTGQVRGLLCRPCNDVLGHFRDDPETFQLAALYLVAPPAERLGITAIHQENRT